MHRTCPACDISENSVTVLARHGVVWCGVVCCTVYSLTVVLGVLFGVVVVV
jgi:hypothetical protein